MASIYESSEMIGAFLDEVDEQLILLEESILSLENNGETPGVIQKIFRVAHTLKGSSSAMGFEKMKKLTHEMENVLDKIRNNVLKATKPVVNTLFQCADNLRLLKEDFASDKSDIKTDISATLGLLETILTGKMPEFKPLYQQSSDLNTFSGPPDGLEMDKERLKLLKQAADCGMFNLICTVRILEESPMKATRACLILNYFNEISTVVDTFPNVMDLPEDGDIRDITYLIISQLDQKEMEHKAQAEIMDIESVKVNSFELPNDEPKVEADQPDFLNQADAEKKIAQTVRVDVERLEKMMNLVGELVIEQTRIAQVGNTLYNRYPSDATIDDLMGISNHVSRVISELQEGVMKARMLPVQQLFNRFPRMVRDLAQELNKDVELTLEGGETEMDRTIIEDINDPLIHIIRNAVDHGIESAEDRIKSGKPAKGILQIRAFHQENHVILTIKDDGAGIDSKKIKASAVKKQIITQQEADNISDQDALNLIFHPGFSTAKAVSDVSGRGVGMEIVRNHIDKLNGIINIDTKVGEGTTFIIKLPLTLAILTGLLVKINDDIFALPMSNVLEIVRKPESEIESVKGQAVAVIRDNVLPLIWLHDYFSIPRRKRGKNAFIVVLGVAEKRIGLVVDELVGNQEIVIKPLGAYIGKVEGYSGATILGDGSVACILDIVGIAKMVNGRKFNNLYQGE